MCTQRYIRGFLGVGLVALLLGMLPVASWSATELKVGYMKHPIHEVFLKWLQRWAAQRGGVTITLAPISYEVYVEKITANLTSRGGLYDIIWHNDDWGQLWARYLEPVDDVPAMKNVSRWPLDNIFSNDEGKDTAVPFVHTVGTFFYRKDLIKLEEWPKNWDQLVRLSQRLQREGKAKWGYVGGMKYPHTWFSFLWAMWANQCDVFYPIYERRNAELAKHGWKSALADRCNVEMVEFWWDAIHKHKISPPGMSGYTRTDANAIFMAGDAAITMADTTFYGDFNDPAKSKVAGKVDVAEFIPGPRRTKPVAWDEVWAWAIPKDIPAEKKKLAKEGLNWVTLSEGAQRDLWKETGGIPVNLEIREKIMKEDPFLRKLMDVTVKHTAMHAAYYFERWPEVHKIVSDSFVKGVTGKREDIPGALAEGAKSITEAASR